VICGRGWIVALGAVLAACRGEATDRSYPLRTGGDPARGLQSMERVGCAACHDIPGIRTFHARVAPSLDDFSHRAVIAGILPNSPANLTRWLLDPPRVSPHTAMPALGLSDQEARDVAAYLYTLD
jgi:cytochrome c1